MSIITKLLFYFSILIIQVNSILISLSNDMLDVKEDSYKIENKILSIIKNGEYEISGTCSECQISIDKSLIVDLTINSIAIDNSNTGPFVIKKEAKINLILKGDSYILDNELSSNEDEDDFEGAGIKFKSSSSLTISGDGKLTVFGKAKNGIKGASQTNLTINSGILYINATKNALACDNLIIINNGNITINSDSDGIKSEPDEDDSVSQGIIIINGGFFQINTQGDGIQAAYKLIINGGDFNIKTYNGANNTNFDKDNMSAKGLKCSTNEHTNFINELIIKGGKFILDTADDSIHSDYNITITGGNFDISSGDDAIHADQFLMLGENNAENNLINMNIKKSYEGLEGAQVYIFSGEYNIVSSDDGINSAGDTNESCSNNNRENPGGSNMRGPGNNDTNRPEGSYMGGPGNNDTNRLEGSNIRGPGNNDTNRPEGSNMRGPGNNDTNRPEGSNMRGPGNNDTNRPEGSYMGEPGNNDTNRPEDNIMGGGQGLNSQCLIFNIFIFGGKIYVNSEGDGLDANGNITITGGNVEIWGMKSGGDNDPIDKDGIITISGGTVLAGGSQGMDPLHKSSKTIKQNFIYTTNSFNADNEISIKNGDNIIKTIKVPKNINYLFYTSNETSQNYKFSEGNTNYYSYSSNNKNSIPSNTQKSSSSNQDLSTPSSSSSNSFLSSSIVQLFLSANVITLAGLIIYYIFKNFIFI